MKNLYLDQVAKDLTLTTNKNLKLTENNTEFISQKIENRFLTIQEEWFLDYTLGLPYLALDNIDRDDSSKNIFVKNPDLNFVNGVFLSELIDIKNETNLIEKIVNFETEFDTAARTYSLDFEIQISGEETSTTLTFTI